MMYSNSMIHFRTILFTTNLNIPTRVLLSTTLDIVRYAEQFLEISAIETLACRALGMPSRHLLFRQTFCRLLPFPLAWPDEGIKNSGILISIFLYIRGDFLGFLPTPLYDFALTHRATALDWIANK